MKKLLLIFLLFSCKSFVYSQLLPIKLKGTTIKKIQGFDLENKHFDIPQGVNVSFIKVTDKNQKIYLKLECENRIGLFDYNYIKSLEFTANNNIEFWQKKALLGGVYSNICENGVQTQVRKDNEVEALRCIEFYETNGFIFSDSYLEDYLYSLIYKIIPGGLKDGRTAVLNVKIIKDPQPNARIYPNGSMLINTGLISVLDCEDELVSILTHEVAHFVMDHSMLNFNAAIKRQKNAEFWTGIATGIAGIVDIAANSNSSSLGILTYSTNSISSTISDQINERLGFKYQRDQESSADDCAIDMLKFLGKDTSAFSSALSKIKEYYVENGYEDLLTIESTHPSLLSRIKRGGVAKGCSDLKYDKLISFITTENAIEEFKLNHINQSLKLCNRNIAASVDTEHDLLIKSIIITRMSNDEKDNLTALSLLDKAEGLKAYPIIDVTKQKAIVLLRLNKKNDAIENLQKYLDDVNQLLQISNRDQSTPLMIEKSKYLHSEQEWTSKMISKIKRS